MVLVKRHMAGSLERKGGDLEEGAKEEEGKGNIVIVGAHRPINCVETHR